MPTIKSIQTHTHCTMAVRELLSLLEQQQLPLRPVVALWPPVLVYSQSLLSVLALSVIALASVSPLQCLLTLSARSAVASMR